MRNKIWYEMVHAKFQEIYLAYYLTHQKTIKKRIKIFTLIFSASGIFAWTIWESGILAFFACIVISIMQLVELIKNEVVTSESEIEDIGEYRNKHINYFNKIEKLWIDYENDSLNENEANEAFYDFRLLKEEIEAFDNKLHLRKSKSLIKKAEIDTNEYLKQFHN